MEFHVILDSRTRAAFEAAKKSIHADYPDLPNYPVQMIDAAWGKFIVACEDARNRKPREFNELIDTDGPIFARRLLLESILVENEARKEVFHAR